MTQFENDQDRQDREEQLEWMTPAILEEGKVEAKLFSDEPDPWGGP